MKLEDIDTPGDIVELDVDSGDLEVFVDGEEVEASDRVTGDAKAVECPAPDDLAVASDKDFAVDDAWDWMLRDGSKPVITADSRWCINAELKGQSASRQVFR